MDLRRLGRAPAGVTRRWRKARRDYEFSHFSTDLGIDTGAPRLLLSPHCDDAVFDCWALLSDGSPLIVVNIFAGIPEPGPPRRWDTITGAQEAASRARERLAEDTEALALAERVPVNLGLLDAEYREPRPAPSLRDLDRTLTGLVGSCSHVYAPAALGQNSDHQLTRTYARAMAHLGMPVSLYADLPYCITHGWPFWVDGSDRDPHRDVDVFWRTMLTDVPEIDDLHGGEVTRLDDEQAGTKLQAMRTYRTQFTSLDGGGVKLLSNPETHRFEVSWKLNKGMR